MATKKKSRRTSRSKPKASRRSKRRRMTPQRRKLLQQRVRKLTKKGGTLRSIAKATGLVPSQVWRLQQAS